jgi:hypothetical protein
MLATELFGDPFLNILLVVCIVFSIFLIITSYNISPHGAEQSILFEHSNVNRKMDKFIPIMTPEVFRKLGPVKNFHQSFLNCGKVLPELGWRNYYLKSNSSLNLLDNSADDNFKGTSIGNFLNNLENTRNIYRGEI